MKGIYKFQNKINKKVYIGQSINLDQRYKRHLSNYFAKKNDTMFYQALQQYGLDNFDYEVLESNDNFTQDDLNRLEQEYIKNMIHIIMAIILLWEVVIFQKI